MSLSRKRHHSENGYTISDTENTKKAAINYNTIGKLFSVNESQQHIIIPRKSSGVIIGRSSSCDIRLSGNDVSLKHCRLSITVKARRDYIYITDLSTNGTFVNDETLGKGTTSLLKSGDKVKFARTGGEFIFRYSSDPNGADGPRSFFDDYILGTQLGSGHYAVVKEARDRASGDIVAVKIFHPNRSASGDAEEDAKLQQEMNLLLSINHPNIVKFISRYVEPISPHAMTTYLVLEKMNSGELFQRIINKLKLGQAETKAIFTQLLAGLKYLHESNIIHRDIKPENILLDISPRVSPDQKQTGPWDEHEYDVKVKIADFGLAKFIGELKFTNTLCGTPAYVAPEILSDKRNYTTKVDLWLSGVLLYVCLCGFPPFSEELAPPSMREQILTGKFAFYSPYWDDISDSALDLISSLLIVDPLERYDVFQTCNHFWFSEDDAKNELGLSMEMSGNTQRTSFRSDSQPMSLRERHASELNVSQSRDMSMQRP